MIPLCTVNVNWLRQNKLLHLDSCTNFRCSHARMSHCVFVSMFISLCTSQLFLVFLTRHTVSALHGYTATPVCRRKSCPHLSHSSPLHYKQICLQTVQLNKQSTTILTHNSVHRDAVCYVRRRACAEQQHILQVVMPQRQNKSKRARETCESLLSLVRLDSAFITDRAPVSVSTGHSEHRNQSYWTN